MTPIAGAQACPFFRDGHCTIVSYPGAAKAVSCSLQAGRYEDCPIFREAPRA